MDLLLIVDAVVANGQEKIFKKCAIPLNAAVTMLMVNCLQRVAFDQSARNSTLRVSTENLPFVKHFQGNLF